MRDRITGSELEKYLNLHELKEEDHYDVVIDKYIIYLYNKKDELSKKAFTTKVVEIICETDWDGYEELDFEDYKQDWYKYKILRDQSIDNQMACLYSSMYRIVMNHFNKKLKTKYPELISNKTNWEYEFDDEENDYQEIDTWLQWQIDKCWEDEGLIENLEIKKLKGKELITMSAQTGSTILIPEDVVKAGYRDLDEYRKNLNEAKISYYGADIINWPCNRLLGQDIPPELKEYFPLSNLELDIEEARRLCNRKLEEGYDENEIFDEYLIDFRPYDKLEKIETIDFFDKHYIEILMFFSKECNETELELSAFEKYYSASEFKAKLVEFYQDTSNQPIYKAQLKRDQELLTKVRAKLSTVLWPEGKEASEWWSKKADEKKIEGDENYALLAEMISKFHNKLISGTEILNPVKELAESEKARILKDMIKVGKWFISVNQSELGEKED